MFKNNNETLKKTATKTSVINGDRQWRTSGGSDVPELQRPIVTARHDMMWITEKFGSQHFATVSGQSMLQHHSKSSSSSSSSSQYSTKIMLSYGRFSTLWLKAWSTAEDWSGTVMEDSQTEKQCNSLRQTQELIQQNAILDLETPEKNCYRTTTMLNQQQLTSPQIRNKLWFNCEPQTWRQINIYDNVLIQHTRSRWSLDVQIRLAKSFDAASTDLS